MGKDIKGKDIGKGFSQRKDGRYEARTLINGVKIDLYDTNLARLRKKFAEEKDRITNKLDEKNQTLAEWYKKWFTQSKAPTLKSEISRSTYDRKVRNTYIRLLGEYLMSDIKQLDIQGATNQLTNEGYCDRTIREGLGVLRECMDIAVVNNIITVNPCVAINIKTSMTQAERRVMTRDEQNLFLSEVSSSYYYEAYAILLLTGMRIGEFSALRWEDIDFVKREFHIKRSMSTAYLDGRKIEEITTPKTSNSFRRIPFFGNVEELLESWKAKQIIYKEKMGKRWRAKPEHGNLVFTSTVGSPVTRYVIVHDLNKVVENINLKEMYAAVSEGRTPVTFGHLHPHAFRHTFATRCFEKGLNPLFVQSIMGHANYSTTVSYTHLLQESMTEEIEKAGDLFCVRPKLA